MCPSVAKSEVDADDGCDFDWLAIDQVRVVAPGLRSVLCSAAQESMTLDDVQVLDGTVFGDDGLHDYLSLHVREAGQLGVGGWRG